MNERRAQTLLMRHVLDVKQHSVAVPNSRELLHHEADLLSVTKAGLVHEFEIKCAIADYRRDFVTKASKHWFLANQPIPYNTPNYFWFVTADFPIEPPTYAGWIRIMGGRLYYRKAAPRLHAGKWDDSQIAKIARLLSYRLTTYYEKNGNEAS